MAGLGLAVLLLVGRQGGAVGHLACRLHRLRHRWERKAGNEMQTKERPKEREKERLKERTNASEMNKKR